MSIVGERLRAVRMALGKSQSRVADDLGMAKSTISQYETGVREPDYDTLQKLADYYGIYVSQLVEQSHVEQLGYSKQEDDLIKAYRTAPDFIKMAVCRLLGVSP